MISLVTATLGRVDEIEDLLISLTNQTYKDFELILVDQNEHRLVEDLVGKYQALFSIIYIRSDKKGLSLNRNIGIKVASGNIIGFPDDDCYYNDNVLEQVYENLKNPDIKFVSVEAIDLLTNQKFITKPNKHLTRSNIIKFCISYNVFLNFNPSLRFDEKLGVGAEFSSGEETDYLWTAISENDKGIFANTALVYHPQNSSSNNYHRAFSYGLGFGAIFKKEYFRTKKISVLLQFCMYLLRSLVGIVLSKNKQFYYKTLIGRITGFINFKVS